MHGRLRRALLGNHRRAIHLSVVHIQVGNKGHFEYYTVKVFQSEKFFILTVCIVFRLKYEPKSSSNSTLQFPTAATANPTHHFSGYGSLGISPTGLMPGSSTPEQFQVAKPRMRICFDPETEIPRLQKWFAENNHPTRQQVGVKNDLF